MTKFHFVELTSGLRELKANYTSTAGKALLAPAGSTAIELRELTIIAKGTSSDYNQFAGLTLTTGLAFQLERKNGSSPLQIVCSLFQGVAIKSTEDLGFAKVEILPDNSDAIRTTKWVINLEDEPLIINGRFQQRLASPLADNFSTLRSLEIWGSGISHLYL